MDNSQYNIYKKLEIKVKQLLNVFIKFYKLVINSKRKTFYLKNSIKLNYSEIKKINKHRQILIQYL